MPVSIGGVTPTNPAPTKSQTNLNTAYGVYPKTDTSTAPSTPRPTFESDLAAATKISDGLLAGKEPAHVTDPHAADNAAELARLQARLGGLDSKEMLAAKEQGLASLDQSTAQNLERYGSIAGAHGVQGGAAASLMGRALQENNQGRAQLERQLVLDNIAAKDNASQAYGAFLNGQTANGIGMSTANTAADNAYTGLGISLPFDIMSGMGTYTAADDAAALNEKALGIAEKAAGGGAPSAPAVGTTGEPNRNIVAESDQISINKITSSIDDVTKQLGEIVESGTGFLKAQSLTDLLAMFKERINLTHADEPASEKTRILREQWQQALFSAGVVNTHGGARIFTELPSDSLFSFE
jgi:hypothetical protein